MVNTLCIMGSLEPLANIPHPEREVFVTQCLRLANRREMPFIDQEHLIVQLLNRIRASERENFVTQGRRLTYDSDSEFIDIESLQLLANIPHPERDVFVTQCLRLAGMFEYVTMRTGLFQLLQGIPPAERQAFLTQALHVIEIAGSTFYGKNRIEALARVPSVEREARVTRARNQIAIDFPPGAPRDPGTFMYRFTELLETPSEAPLRPLHYRGAAGLGLAGMSVRAADRDEAVLLSHATGAMRQGEIERENVGFLDYLRRQPDSPNRALLNFRRNAPN